MTTLGDTIELAIKAHQLHAGVALPILEYTDRIPWMSDCWLSNAREFLHKIQGKIKLASPWVIDRLRQNDTHLMLNFQNAVIIPKNSKPLTTAGYHSKSLRLPKLLITLANVYSPKHSSKATSYQH